MGVRFSPAALREKKPMLTKVKDTVIIKGCDSLSVHGMEYFVGFSAQVEKITATSILVTINDDKRNQALYRPESLLKPPVQPKDIVRVSDTGSCYRSYTDWFKRYHPSLLPEYENQIFVVNREVTLRDYEVVCLGRHKDSDKILAAIQGIANQEVVLINVDAIVLSKAYNEEVTKEKDWNGPCPFCGFPAYIGLTNIECSRNCHN